MITRKMILLAVILLFLCGCEKSKSPYYFIAIHNEAGNQDNNTAIMQEEYTTLMGMVTKADGYNIKLTIMISPQLADYLASDTARLSVAQGWMARGHELAARHHGADTYNWDGYSMYLSEEIFAKRANLPYKGIDGEKYYGTMNDFMAPLRKVNPDIKAGCCNDEKDKNELANGIIYDTCSGLANYGTPGTAAGDIAEPKNWGINEFVTIGTWNGIQRRWINHFLISDDNAETFAEETFSSMTGGAYGAFVHSSEEEALQLYKYMEFLHSKDPKGKKSRTVSQIIEQKLLPEQIVSEDMLKTTAPGLSMMNYTVSLNATVGTQINQTTVACMSRCMTTKNNTKVCEQDCGIKRTSTVRYTAAQIENLTTPNCMQKCMSTINDEQQCKQQCAPSNDSCIPKCMEVRNNLQECEKICTSDDTCMPDCMAQKHDEQQCLLDCAPEDSDPCMVDCMIKNNNKEQCTTECAPSGDGGTCMPECMAQKNDEDQCLKDCAPSGPDGGDDSCMPDCMAQYNNEEKCKKECAPEGEEPPDSGQPPQ